MYVYLVILRSENKGYHFLESRVAAYVYPVTVHYRTTLGVGPAGLRVVFFILLNILIVQNFRTFFHGLPTQTTTTDD